MELASRQVFVGLVVLAMLLSLVPAPATAQTGGGGTIIVDEGETVSEVSAVAGTVVVRGTVTGDVSVLAGDVRVEEGGTVEGDLSAAAGNVRISGTVNGVVSAGAGNVHVQETGTVGGNFDVGAGNVIIDGTIEGDATIGAETIRLGEDAEIAGSLTYDGELEGNLGAVQGDITRDPTIGAGLATDFQPLATAVFAAYAFLLNLILGAILLFLFPRFSAEVADRVVTDPVRTGLIGLGLLIAIPVLLLALVITVVGIPLMLVGAIAFTLLAWIGVVYGRFAVGAWLLSLAEVDNRWAALVVGLLLGAIFAQVPVIGGLLNFLIFLLGFGALARGLYGLRQSRAEPGVAPEKAAGE